MARKMADEILRAEKDGEKIITAALETARQITEQAKLDAVAQAEKVAKEASSKAQQIAADAKAAAENEKQAAEAEAKTICETLEKSFNQSSDKAVRAATDILIS